MEFKNLSDTSVFKYTEKMLPGDKLTSTIAKLTSDQNNFVTAEQLEDVFYKIRHKSFTFKAKFAIIDLFNKGVIKLVYNPNISLTVALPFFKYKMPTGGYGTIINITNYAKVKDDVITIDPNTLYCLMVSAMCDLIYKTNTSILALNGLPQLYGNLFTNIIARLCNLDIQRRYVINYIATKFMYVQLGYDDIKASQNAVNIDTKAGFNFTATDAEKIDLAIPAGAYANLELLIDALREAMPEFKSITYGAVFEQWMRVYGESSAYALEYIPAFITLFVALITNCANIVNIKAIEKEANKHSQKLVMLFNYIEQAVVDHYGF